VTVTDDGSGIPVADRALVCQRYCTSKLRSFQDLETVATYGFRGTGIGFKLSLLQLLLTTLLVCSLHFLPHPPGEALNSLCSVSDLIITTRCPSEAVAVQMQYDPMGKLKQLSV
jgi:DNA mismatch repair ATPase MutL